MTYTLVMGHLFLATQLINIVLDNVKQRKTVLCVVRAMF